MTFRPQGWLPLLRHTSNSFLFTLTGIALVLMPLPTLAQVAPSASAVRSLPSPLTLTQALSIALHQQPQLYNAQDQQTQARGQQTQAKAQYQPVLTPTYQYQQIRQTQYGRTYGFLTSPGTTTTINNPTGTTGSGGTTTTGTGTGGTGTGGTGTTTGGQSGAALSSEQTTTTTGTGSGGTITTTTPTTILTPVTSQTLTTRGGALSISLSQTLFDMGQREIVNAQARRARDAARFNLQNTRQTVIDTVTEDYYNLLRAYDLVKVSQAQVANAQQVVDLTKAQIAVGTVPAKDVYQSQADLANAQVTLLQNQNSVRTTSAALKNAMGVETDQVVQPAPLPTAPVTYPGGAPLPGVTDLPQTTLLPALPVAGQERTLDEYVALGYASRADLRQQAANIQSLNESVKLARINSGLLISGTSSVSYTPQSDLGSKGTSVNVLVNSSYPLFDGGSSRAGVRIAEASRDQAKNGYEQLRQNIRLAIEQAYVSRAQALAQAGLAQSAVAAGQVNYAAAVASRREGAGTVVDISTAQVTLTQAQNQYVTAIYNYYVADAQLRRAIGQNDNGNAGL